ncbi:MAG TPA: hypothetical protein VFK87_02435, partial [Steroidobacteraceae bacterium]|nr:hypothetical protein [Steroidobacteraceae bacterium]
MKARNNHARVLLLATAAAVTVLPASARAAAAATPAPAPETIVLEAAHLFDSTGTALRQGPV